MVATHAGVRAYREQSSGIDVPGVLVRVCDECDRIAAIPAQSAPRIREARVPLKEEQLEARIPTHLEDVLYLLAREFAAPVQAFRPAVLRFYLAELLNDASLAERVRLLAASELADAPVRARISLRVPAELLAAVRETARAAGIAKDSELIRGLLLAAKEDVLDGRHRERILKLSGAAQAQGAYRPPSPYEAG
jgi:predicted DNA binding CopG/RHH family protein